MRRLAKDRLIVALDVDSIARARELVARLKQLVGMFKVGSQLFTAAGPDIVREIVQYGEKVFLDLKFHDIPNTVASAAAEAARLGVTLLNVHASGGREMMRRAAAAVSETATKEGLPRPALLAVTVLTSMDSTSLREIGVQASPEDQVAELAKLAAASGMDGVVASPQEVVLIRKVVIKPDFLVVTPGIRPLKSPSADQKRVMTPVEAIHAGADYLVVGRPIIDAPDPAAAARELVAEIQAAI